MADQTIRRRLSAVLAADVVGYTRLMEEDSQGTVVAWSTARDDVIEPAIAEHSGRTVKLTGDGFLAEFSTVEDAVRCAIALQKGLVSSSLDFRIGVNLGDIIDDGRDIHGEGVNVAARLEGLAEPGGIVISGDVYNQVKNRIDVRFEDMGAREVKHVSDPVRAYAVVTDDGEKAPPSIEDPIARKPSIAVLPFDNLSGDPEQEYFSDGITEDIITALSRIRHFFVIARNTTFTYKAQAVDVQTIAKDLGARFVLEGSVRKAGERIRITAQLIDGVTGNHLWAEKYDRNLEDIFAVQDEITQTVVGAIEPEMAKAERDRAIIQRPDSLGAWDLCQRGMAHLWDQGEHGQPQELENALNNFNESAALDPRFSLAYTGIAWCHCYEVLFGLTEDRQRTLELGFAAVKKAVELDQQDVHAYAIWAAFHFLNREPEEAIRKCETAIKINPSHGTVRIYLGMSLIAIGAASDGVQQMDLARKISPGDITVGPGMAWTAIGYLGSGLINSDRR